MARLFDKALAYRPPSGNNRNLFTELQEGLQWATPLVCDDLLPYAPDDTDFSALSGVRVPWPLAFVEWRNNQGIELGVTAFEVDADVVHGGPPPNGATRTIVMRGMSARRKSDQVLAWADGIDIDVTENGDVVDYNIRFLDPDFERDLAADPDRAKTMIRDLIGIAHLAGWFLMAANAKNIEIEPVEPSAGLSRNWRRKTGQPLHSYNRVLLPHDARSGSSRRSGGAPAPLEIVKGHFKTYDDQRPLFGKLTGTWWWAPFARGDASAGVREHDYAFGPEAPDGNS
ncbi:hypothetical protein [Desertimonas flava]|uniref:hypothetical protein n=1 Tax=Desertimonas flava TaxID=2064846 RepID=UPI0013C51BE5|nr:hypothetical protein [Desertimonas flava]